MRFESILPIGNVNLLTGKQPKGSTFNNVFDCWASGSCTCILYSTQDYFTKVTRYRVVVTSGSLESTAVQYPVGSIHHFQHDQTMQKYQGDFRVEGVYPHTADGHKAILCKTGKTSVSFATYK